MSESSAMVCILGPTAVGKTSAAVALARLADGEIISKEPRLTVQELPADAGTDAFDSTARLRIEVPQTPLRDHRRGPEQDGCR